MRTASCYLWRVDPFDLLWNSFDVSENAVYVISLLAWVTVFQVVTVDEVFLRTVSDVMQQGCIACGRFLNKRKTCCVRKKYWRISLKTRQYIKTVDIWIEKLWHDYATQGKSIWKRTEEIHNTLKSYNRFYKRLIILFHGQ